MVLINSKNPTKILHPLSVIDGRNISLKDAFSWLLNYYDPNKKDPNIKSVVLDSTCSEMLIWQKRDFLRFLVETNDIRIEIEANYHYDCKFLHQYLPKLYYDIIIYDPPYINLDKRKDKEKYEKAFNYNMMNTLSDLEDLTIESSYSFNRLLKNEGVLIIKITNFHVNGKIYGYNDMVNWFSRYFFLYDELIYRFFKPIPNLNFYNKKVAKTHSYFLIFKKKKI